MNTDRLIQILRDTTVQLRKGEAIVESGNEVLHVTEIYAMPHVSEAVNLEKVDCHFVVIGVDKKKALGYKQEVIQILSDWPGEAWGVAIPKLQDGPSYIHAGGVIGDQGLALQLFGLGQVLDIWQIMTPEKFGFSGEQADQMAGSGFVMIDGFKI